MFTTFVPHFALRSLLLMLPFIISVVTVTAQSFKTPTDYAVGDNPNSGAAGDFNADGKPDLAIANAGSKNVSILLNNGNGTFASAVNYTTDFNPEGVATGDFNADGKVDLAVANFEGGPFSAGNISILLGNGNGTFQAAVNYDAGSPGSISVADFNADGKQDLVVVSFITSKVNVLLGNGNGTFQAAVPYTVGSEPRDVAVADYNGDTKLDLAISNNTTISILLGNGNGTFQGAVTIDVSTRTFGLVTTDLNGDNKKDLITACADAGAVKVLLGNGDGSFQTPVPYPVGNEPQHMTLADFNGDGKTDVLVVNDQIIATYSVLRGNGDGTFQSALTSPLRNNSITPIAADFDTDGKPDVGILNNAFDLVDGFINSPKVTGLNVTATDSVPATVQVATFITFDNTKTAPSFTATINWGDGTAPSAGSVSANGSGGFNVTGTHTFTAAGNYNTTIQIADDSGNFASGTGTAVVVPTVSVNDVSVNEGDSGTRSLTFTVTLSSPSSSTVTVDYATAAGTATAGVDYQSASGTLIFSPGDTTKNLSINVFGDTANEADETFFFNISNAVNATIVDAQGVGTILNDDAPVLLIDPNTGRAVALDSVTMTADPFSLTNPFNLDNQDHRRRVSLFVWRLGLLPTDTAANVTVTAEDGVGGVYSLAVEYVGAFTPVDGLTQIVVRLPDSINDAPGDLSVKVQLHGPASNSAIIKTTFQ